MELTRLEIEILIAVHKEWDYGAAIALFIKARQSSVQKGLTRLAEEGLLLKEGKQVFRLTREGRKQLRAIRQWASEIVKDLENA